MLAESDKNVFLNQIDASSFAEFEISEFEISRFDCILLLPWESPEQQIKSEYILASQPDSMA